MGFSVILRKRSRIAPGEETVFDTSIPKQGGWQGELPAVPNPRGKGSGSAETTPPTVATIASRCRFQGNCSLRFRKNPIADHSHRI